MGAIHHALGPGPISKRRNARSLVADRVNELEILIVAERYKRIALPRIAQRASDPPELFRDGDLLQADPARLADLQLIPAFREENVTGLAPVDLDIILAAPAFVAARGDLAAFEHTSRAIFELG